MSKTDSQMTETTGHKGGLGLAGRTAKTFIHSPLSPLLVLAMLGMGLLGLMVTQLVRHDAWMRAFYRRIKKRRGAKIARVAVMRRMCTVIYRMLEKNEPYAVGGPTAVLQQREVIETFPSNWAPEDAGSEFRQEEMPLATGG